MPLLIALLVLLTPPLTAQQVGPASGTLVIMGGGPGGRDIVERFVELAGGPAAHIVVIPTAGGGERYDSGWEGLNRLREVGANNLTVVHTYDPEVARRPGFADPIRRAAGVWIAGGRQWRLVDAYENTPVLDELNALLARGGVIGGTSAGASIMGSYLVRGDTRSNTIMMGDHEVGFGWLRQTAIDQHLLRRNRQHDLPAVLEHHPELLGIGLDENTAIVVQGDTATVIGDSYVAIYDPHRTPSGAGSFYLLQPGDRINLHSREPSRPIGGFGPPAAGEPPMHTATGTFTVRITPQPPDDYADGGDLGRMQLDKTFQGDLEGSAKGQMLTAMTPVEGSAGYVAIERVTGTLSGRRGGFVLQHHGIMTRGAPQLTLVVVPDSGTEALAGLAGTMTITIADGVHAYRFEYTLPSEGAR